MNETAAAQWRIVLKEAHEALRTAVEGVPADAWERPTPCERWNVTQVLQHAVGDQLAFAAAIDGGPGPAEDPFAPSGRVDGDKLAGLRAALDASARAWNGDRRRRPCGAHAAAPGEAAGRGRRRGVRPGCGSARLGHRGGHRPTVPAQRRTGPPPAGGGPAASSSRCGPTARTPRRSIPLRRPTRSPLCSPTSVATPADPECVTDRP